MERLHIQGEEAYEDTFTATELSDLDLFLVDSGGTELRLTDALGRASYSESPVDSVEHIYFTLPADDSYTLRVKNLSTTQNEEFGFAVWSIPEPGTLVLFGLAGGITIFTRRLRII